LQGKAALKLGEKSASLPPARKEGTIPFPACKGRRAVFAVLGGIFLLQDRIPRTGGSPPYLE